MGSYTANGLWCVSECTLLGHETGRAEVGKGRQTAVRATAWLRRGAASVAQFATGML